MIIEIIGPAGAGKTTLRNAIIRKMPQIQNEPLPPVWNASYYPFFIKNIIQIAPLIILSPKNNSRNLTRRELAWMAILNGWFQLLKKSQRKNSGIIILDQGPIFLMTILKGFGPEFINQTYLYSWWKKIFQQWSQTLDLVIWLDAADETLIERIDDRESDHIIKGKTGLEVNIFFKKFRSIFENIMEIMLSKNAKIGLIKIDTAQNSIDQVIEKVVSELNLIAKNGFQI